MCQILCLFINLYLESKDVNGTIGGKNQVPEISLEWADIKVSFRIVPDFELENDLHKQHYELFPKLDTCAPSARTIHYLRKKAYKEKNNGTTLSSLLGIPRNQPTPTSEKVSNEISKRRGNKKRHVTMKYLSSPKFMFIYCKFAGSAISSIFIRIFWQA